MTYIKTMIKVQYLLSHTSRAVATVVAAAICLLAFSSHAQDTPQRLPTTTLNAGLYVIRAEVAQTPGQREIGLMNRPTMPVNEGMLFVFDTPGVQCFWMKNTLLPLSIAFLADDGTIINVTEMKAQTLDSHCSAKPVRYALEMNKDWFNKRGIKAGAKITGKPLTP